MALLDRFRRKPLPLMAAAQPLGNPGYRRAQVKLRRHWWTRASFFARNMGAIRFASGIKASSGARCTLTVEKLVNPAGNEWEPVENSQVLADTLNGYRGASATQAELIRLHIWLYETLGEVLQYVSNDAQGRAVWSIRSPLACEWRSDGILIRDVPNGTERDGTATLIDGDYARRLWVPDVDYPGLATSPLEGVLEDCERYWSLARRIKREADSALAMNGILYVDERMSGISRQQSEPGGSDRPGSWLEQDYFDVGKRALEDDDSVESILPMMMSGPADSAPTKIEIARPLDENGIKYRTEALEAIARGLDYPQRLLVDDGGGMNHWGAWLLEEQFAKASLAPSLERICWGDLTETFLRPALRTLIARSLFADDPTMYRVGFDMSPVVVHPDESARALDLYKLGALSDRVLLEVSGFTSADAPSQEEQMRWVARTNVMRESIRPQSPAVLPADVQSVVESTPQTQPGDYSEPAPLAPAPATAGMAVIDVPSRVLVTATAGPMPGEETGWLDD